MAASWSDQGCNCRAIHNDQAMARQARDAHQVALFAGRFSHVHGSCSSEALKALPGEFRRKFQVYGTIDHLIWCNAAHSDFFTLDPNLATALSISNVGGSSTPPKLCQNVERPRQKTGSVVRQG